MGKRTRRVLRTVRRTIPKIFNCPKCGSVSIRVIMKPDNKALITCGHCKIANEYNVTPKSEPIDIYNKFIDTYDYED